MTGNKNNITLNNNAWEENGLKFNGSEDFITIENLKNNLSAITLEIVVKYDDIATPSSVINIGNEQSQGYILNTENNKNSFEVYDTNSQLKISSEENISLTPKYYLAGCFGENTIQIFENGEESSEDFNGNISSLQNDINLILGKNLKGKIYSVRIYDRKLSEDEIKQNYEIDKKRFNIN